MTSDSYDVLTERLGFPGSPRLRHLLEVLMTPEQARLAEALPGSVAEVAEKTGLPEDRVHAGLEALFFSGVVFPKGDFANRTYYRFVRQIIQLHDATLTKKDIDPVKDRDLCEAWQDFLVAEAYTRMGEPAAQSVFSAMSRIVPAYNSIKGLPGVLPHEDFRQMLEAQELIAVVPCSCRSRTLGARQPCARTDEVETWHCLQFGRGAEYVLARGTGRRLSVEEALEVMDRAEADGLLHRWANNDKMTGVNTSCQCCPDCCEEINTLVVNNIPFEQAWPKTRFEAYIPDVGACTGCRECTCVFDAISFGMVEGAATVRAVIDADKCFGCGNCVLQCATGAIKMRIVRPPEHIPAAS